MQTLIVVNPASAGGRTGVVWPQIEAELCNAGVDFEARRTARRGDATEFTRAALEQGVSRVVACGGDGTLNEVVNGFLNDTGVPIAPESVLGVISSGTGGDFRKAVGIPANPAEAAALLAGGQTRQIDAGLIDYRNGLSRCFVNIADCGLGGEVVRRVNSYKRKPGKLAYSVAMLSAALTYKPVHTCVEVDGNTIEGAMVSVVVANGRFFGGGMQIAPNADVADGMFDVVIGCSGVLQGMLGSRHLYRGEHIGRPGTFALRGREVSVTPLGERAMPFDVDGEMIGAAPAMLRVLPGVLKLCAPAPQ